MNQDFVKNCADLVVYGKIFTAEDNQMIHEAQPAATYFEGKKVFSKISTPNAKLKILI